MPSARTSQLTASAAGPLHPFLRWPRAADAGLALAVLVGTVSVVEGPHGTLLLRDPRELPAGVVLALVLAAAALYGRRRAPALVTAIGIAAWAAVVALGYGDLGAPPVIALYSLGRYDDRDLRALVVVGVATAMRSWRPSESPGPRPCSARWSWTVCGWRDGRAGSNAPGSPSGPRRTLRSRDGSSWRNAPGLPGNSTTWWRTRWAS